MKTGGFKEIKDARQDLSWFKTRLKLCCNRFPTPSTVGFEPLALIPGDRWRGDGIAQPETSSLPLHAPRRTSSHLRFALTLLKPTHLLLKNTESLKLGCDCAWCGQWGSPACGTTTLPGEWSQERGSHEQQKEALPPRKPQRVLSQQEM